MTTYLTLDDLVATATALMGAGRVAIRDYGLLESAAARPQASAFGDDAYPTLHLKAAALMESLARNHALIDGNKRLAWTATVLFLLFNDVTLHAPSVDDGEAFVPAVARGEADVDKIALTLLDWSR